MNSKLTADWGTIPMPSPALAHKIVVLASSFIPKILGSKPSY